MPHPSSASLYVADAGPGSAGWQCRPVPAAEDFAFYHENVMGTSLELRVGPTTPRPPAGPRAGCSRDRSPRRRSSAATTRRASSAAGRPRRDGRCGSRRSSSRSSRPATAGGTGAAGRSTPGSRRSRGSGHGRRAATGCRPPTELAAATALMAAPAWRLDLARADGRAPVGLPAEPQRDRQGRTSSSGPATPRSTPGRGVRGLLLNVGGDLRVCGETPADDRIARPGPTRRRPSRSPIEVKDRAVATSGNSQRGFEIEGRMVLPHLRSPDRPARRAGRRRHGHRPAIGRRRRPGDDLQRAPARGEPAPGAGAPRRRVPDRRRATAGSRGARAGADTSGPGRRRLAGRPTMPRHKRRPTGEGRPTPGDRLGPRIRAGRQLRDQPPRGPRPAATAGPTWPSGSRTRTGSRSATYALGLDGRRRAVPVAPRPEALVQGRPGPQAGRQEGHGLHDRPADPPAGQVQGRSGTARTTTASRCPRGEYTLCIDAAREHGTYQNIRKEVTLGDKPFTEELKGNVEIKSASIEYRRKAARRSPPSESRSPWIARPFRRRLAIRFAKSCAGCISTSPCSAWRPSCSSAPPA